MTAEKKGISSDVFRQIEEGKKARETDEVFLLFSMGSQFDHLIKLMLGKIGVFCLVANPKSIIAEDVMKIKPIGIIVSGGPASVHAEPPPFDNHIFDLGIPVLGICLGFQMWASHIGLDVVKADKREFHVSPLTILDPSSKLFSGCTEKILVRNSHGDVINASGKVKILARTENSPVAAGSYRHLHGVQFHPEVSETEHGQQMLESFCFKICGAKDRFPAEDEAEKKAKMIRETVGSKKFIAMLSGGSDSSALAFLIKKAGIPKEQWRAIYLKGVDRLEDEAHVRKYFGNQDWIELVVVDLTDMFLKRLKGMITMLEKRGAFKGMYEDEMVKQAKIFGAEFVFQGTIYTDNCESGIGYETDARRAVIKPHHNAGNKLPEWLCQVTPLDDCVKDGTRNIGRSCGMPEELAIRHPFPGPGRILRIENEITREKLRIEGSTDKIFIEELRRCGFYKGVWQATAVLTDMKVTCSKGDDADIGYVILLKAITSVNGFTAVVADLPMDFLTHVSDRITNEIKEVGAVYYCISGKPPTTIEIG